jgi:hypothetical protein
MYLFTCQAFIVPPQLRSIAHLIVKTLYILWSTKHRRRASFVVGASSDNKTGIVAVWMHYFQLNVAVSLWRCKVIATLSDVLGRCIGLGDYSTDAA